MPPTPDREQPRSRIRQLILLGLLTLFPLLQSCRESPVFIGFIGTLSGRYSQLGISARDGVVFAINEANESGGFQGRSFELLIGNDKGNEETCRAEFRRLATAGAVAIVGPLTSNMEPAIRDAVESGILVVSPTVSTDSLTGLDDYFVRFVPHTGIQGQIATQILRDRNIQSAATIYDTSNARYTEEVVSAFRDYFQDTAHSVVGSYGFNGGASKEIDEKVRALVADSPSALMIVSNGIDGARIAQGLRNNGYTGLLIGSEWTQTAELITLGSGSVEGMIVVGSYIPVTDSARYQRFESDYRTAFGRPPDFATINAYETTSAIVRVIRSSGSTDPDVLRDALVGRVYKGLRSWIRIDRFGDADRPDGYSVVENGCFVRYPHEEN